jgi:hypothetical protein
MLYSVLTFYLLDKIISFILDQDYPGVLIPVIIVAIA